MPPNGPASRSPKCIATFPSTHSVLKAERALIDNGIAVDAIPVPRHISSDCGIGLRFDCQAEEPVRRVIVAAGITISGIFPEK